MFCVQFFAKVILLFLWHGFFEINFYIILIFTWLNINIRPFAHESFKKLTLLIRIVNYWLSCHSQLCIPITCSITRFSGSGWPWTLLGSFSVFLYSVPSLVLPRVHFNAFLTLLHLFHFSASSPIPSRGLILLLHRDNRSHQIATPWLPASQLLFLFRSL